MQTYLYVFKLNIIQNCLEPSIDIIHISPSYALEYTIKIQLQNRLITKINLNLSSY